MLAVRVNRRGLMAKEKEKTFDDEEQRLISLEQKYIYSRRLPHT